MTNESFSWNESDDRTLRATGDFIANVQERIEQAKVDALLDMAERLEDPRLARLARVYSADEGTDEQREALNLSDELSSQYPDFTSEFRTAIGLALDRRHEKEKQELLSPRSVGKGLLKGVSGLLRLRPRR